MLNAGTSAIDSSVTGAVHIGCAQNAQNPALPLHISNGEPQSGAVSPLNVSHAVRYLVPDCLACYLLSHMWLFSRQAQAFRGIWKRLDRYRSKSELVSLQVTDARQFFMFWFGTIYYNRDEEQFEVL